MKRVINGKTYSKTIGVKKGELAAFGDNGELIASGVKAKNIPSFPEGGNVGDVLTKTADGQEWNTPESSAVYNHYLFIDFGNEYGTFVINSSSGTPFNADSLVEVLNSNGIDGSAKNKKIWGYVHISSTDMGSMYLSEYATKKVALQRGTNGSISIYEMTDSRIYDTVVSV